MSKKKPYLFDAKINAHQGHTRWYSVKIPADISKEIIRHRTESRRKTVHVEVTVEKVHWRATLFEDEASKTFMLPLNNDPKDKNAYKAGDIVHVELGLLG
jgi:hypothetical protein